MTNPSDIGGSLAASLSAYVTAQEAMIEESRKQTEAALQETAQEPAPQETTE